MRVMVLGATGIVGRGVVTALAEAGCQVIAASRTATAVHADSVTAIRFDRRRPADYAAALAAHRPDGLIDLTCWTPDDAAATVIASGRVDRVIVVSSVSAAGGSGTVPVSETNASAPTGTYGEDKLAAEQVLAAAWAAGTSSALVVRLGAVYRTGGPLDGQLAEDGYWLRHLLAGQRPVLADSGRTQWNLLHARDAGRALLALLENPAANSTSVLVGSRHPFPWRAFYERIYRAFDQPFDPVSLPTDLIRERIPESEFLDEASGWDQVYDLSRLEALAPKYQERESHGQLVDAARWLINAGRIGDANLAERIASLGRYRGS